MAWTWTRAEAGLLPGREEQRQRFLLFIWREYLDLAQVRASCAERNVACRFRPTDFNRFAIYGGIGFAQVMGVFTIGLLVEERKRRQTLAPEWR